MNCIQNLKYRLTTCHVRPAQTKAESPRSLRAALGWVVHDAWGKVWSLDVFDTLLKRGSREMR